MTAGRLSRRQMLGGLGALAATPLLASLRAPLARGAEGILPRLLIVHLPNGMLMSEWTPTGPTLRDGLTRALQPLAPFVDDMLLLKGLRQPDLSMVFSNFHADLAPALLSGEDLAAGIVRGPQQGATLDQVVGASWGEEPLVLCAEGPFPCIPSLAQNGDECEMMGHISWRGVGTPVVPESDPIALRERLYGIPAMPPTAIRSQWVARHRAATDAAVARSAAVLSRLPASDRPRIEAWLDALYTSSQTLENPPLVCEGTELPPSSDLTESGRLLDELGQVATLALAAGIRRTVTLSLGRELSRRTLTANGVDIGHHTVSHYTVREDFPDKLKLVIDWEMQKVATLLANLSSLPACNGGRLLDQTIVLVAGAMSDPQAHDPNNLPVLLLGGRALGLETGGRILDFQGEIMPRLYLTLLERLSLPTAQFGAEATSSLTL
jgi:hypothetical protein